MVIVVVKSGCLVGLVNFTFCMLLTKTLKYCMFLRFSAKSPFYLFVVYIINSYISSRVYLHNNVTVTSWEDRWDSLGSPSILLTRFFFFFFFFFFCEVNNQNTKFSILSHQTVLFNCVRHFKTANTTKLYSKFW